MSGTTDFLYNTATNLGTLYTATTDGVAQLNQLPAIKDTEVQAEQKPTPVGYVNSTNRPQLPQPGVSTPGGFNHALNLLNNFPEVVLGFMNAIPVPDGEDKFTDDMNELLKQLGQDKLSLLGNGDPKTGLAKLKYAILHPGAQFPKEISDLAQQIREKATDSAGYGASNFIITVSDAADSMVSRSYFEEAVRGAGLSPDELKQVLFAGSFPETAASLPPKLQNVLKTAEASALTQSSKNLGVPSDYQIPQNTDGMKEMLTEQFSDNVNKQLNELMNSGKISRPQYNELRTLFAMPGANTPHAAALMPLLQQVMTNAKGQLSKDYGMPASFDVPVNGSSYQAMLNGTYFNEFNKQLNNPTLNLTADQQAQLKEALTSKSAENALSPELKTILNTLKATTLAKVATTYGLPDTWQPDTNALAAAAIRTQDPDFKAAKEGLNQCIEALNTGKKILSDIVEAAPKNIDGSQAAVPPIAFLLKDYLKALSSVLSEMQEIQAEAAIASSNLASLLSKVQNDSKMAELWKKSKEIHHMMAEQKKMASLGPLKAIIQWIINLFLIFTPLGPLLLINALAQQVKQAKEGKGLDLAHMDMLGDLGKTCQDIGKAIGGPFGKFLGDMLQLALAILTFVAGGGAAILADTLIGSGSYLKLILTGLGIPPKIADYIAMALQIVIQIAAAIALAVFTGGASIGALVADLAVECGQFVGTILMKVAQVIDYIERVLSRVMNFIGLGSAAAKISARTTPKLLEAAIKNTKAFVVRVQGYAASLSTNNLANLSSLETQSQDAKAALDAATKGGDPAEIRTAQGAADVAQAAYDAALRPVEEAQKFTNRIVFDIQENVMNTLTIVQTSVMVNNNIIKIEVEKIKAIIAELEISVDAFIAIIKAVIQKLMAAVKSLGEDIAATVKLQQDLFTGMSQVVNSLFA